MRKILTSLVILAIVVGFITFLFHNKKTPIIRSQPAHAPTLTPVSIDISQDMSPLSMDAMRSKKYLGSTIAVKQTLPQGENYNRYIVSYLSDGLTIYGLLTVPTGIKPSGGWPVIVINHGYIPPTQYSTVSSYSTIVAAFAAHGYIVFKPDYRGNGNSQGQPVQVYVMPDYLTDSLNAIASIKQYPDANKNKIGIWGHSMGGNITLHELVLPIDAQGAVIWSGVVGNYTDILSWWDKRVATGVLTTQNDLETAEAIAQFTKDHGTPSSNSHFWNMIDPTDYLSWVSEPVLIQVGTKDEVVPQSFSISLYNSLKGLGKNAVLKTYTGADHNLSPDSVQALQDSLSFFDEHLK